MSAIVLIVIAVVAFIIAYLTYGSFIIKNWGGLIPKLKLQLIPCAMI